MPTIAYHLAWWLACLGAAIGFVVGLYKSAAFATPGQRVAGWFIDVVALAVNVVVLWLAHRGFP